MRCGNLMCEKRSNGVVANGKQYCSASCVQGDSACLSKGTPSEETDQFGRQEHGDQSEAYLQEDDETLSDQPPTASLEQKTQRTDIGEIRSQEGQKPMNQRSDEDQGTQNSSGGMTTRGVPEANLPDKYFGPPNSSSPVGSASVNMINESVTQLNSIRKSVFADLQETNLEEGAALIKGHDIAKIKTYCMVSYQLVNMMRLGLDISKVMQDK